MTTCVSKLEKEINKYTAHFLNKTCWNLKQPFLLPNIYNNNSTNHTHGGQQPEKTYFHFNAFRWSKHQLNIISWNPFTHKLATVPRDCFPFQPYLFWNRCYTSKLISLWRSTLFSISTSLLWVRALRTSPSGQSFPKGNNQSPQIAAYRGRFRWQLTLLGLIFLQFIMCQHVGSINNLLHQIGRKKWFLLLFKVIKPFKKEV